MNINSNFKLFRSSAGSGKTHTLAFRFILLSIQGNGDSFQEDYYKKILAITFTNKAVTEMKERVLRFLYFLSKKEDADGILVELQKITGLDKEVIFNRSNRVFHHILHHYTNLSISTIDKFTYRIVRTFSYDLGLSYNFDVEMDSDKIIRPVVAMLLSKVSESGGDLTNALVNFTLTKVDEGKSINIEKDLEEFSKQLFREETERYIDNKILTINECVEVKRKISQQKESLKKKIILLSSKVSSYFQSNGLTQSHFINGTFYKHFSYNICHQDDTRWIPSVTLQKNISNDLWCPVGRSDDFKNSIEMCKKDLIGFYQRLLELIVEYNSCKAILKNIYSIAILNELIKNLRLYKKQHNIEHISEFNKKIHDLVTMQSSSYIYERLGERFSHYLIDEFQDTSILQWQNLLPLITDAIDYGETVVVGDGKQSIYRWRGGEVEQFLRLPNIYKSDDLRFAREWESKLDHHHVFHDLEFNYRSRKEIVCFNNHFFDRLKLLLSSNLSSIYDNHYQKPKELDSGGYINIELFDDKDNDFKELILERILKEINNLRANHLYSLRDITILCNSRKRVALVAKYLSSNSIPVISDEGLLIRNSEEVGFVISWLRYLQNSNNVIAKAAIITYIHKNILIHNNIHALNKEGKEIHGFNKILERADIFINLTNLLGESLYEMVEGLIRCLNINVEIYLQFFLDLVLSYTESEGSNLSLFLEWWDENKEKEAIIIPEGIDAVHIMTIHKSKGLAFNVVMIPFNWEDSSNKNDIWVDTSEYFNNRLPFTLLRKSKYLEYSFFKDEYIKEKELELLDSLNKLYVAMTRAKERLYIFSKEFPKKISSDFVLKRNLNSFLYQFSREYPFNQGEEYFKHSTLLEEKDTFTVINESKINWREIISLKNSALEIWDVDNHDLEKDWGKLFHRVLSEIHYIRDKDKVIDSFYKRGDCINEDCMKLKEHVEALLGDPQIQKYFDSKWDVKTEKKILLNTGETYIPDRLLFDKNSDKIVVIDYKTGEERHDHIRQISEYGNILGKMGYKDIEKVLIYTSKKNKVKRV